MNHLLRAGAALFLVMYLVGCGQSGPLYVPGNPSTIQAPPQSETTQNIDESEDDEDDESVTP